MNAYMEEIKENESFPFRFLYSTTPKKMLPHWHRYIELMYFYNTESCEYFCRGKKLEIKSNDLIIANTFDVHECEDFGMDAEVCCIIVDPKMLGIYKDTLFLNLASNDHAINDIFHKIKNARGSSFFEITLAGYIYELFSVLLEKYIISETDEKNMSYYHLLIKNLKNVMEYINDNINREIRVSELAAIANLSTDRFYHVFKENTGISPTTYIEKQRILKACKLLPESEIPITTIALECGFCDSSYFAKRFKMNMGLSPNQFRQKTGASSLECSIPPQ